MNDEVFIVDDSESAQSAEPLEDDGEYDDEPYEYEENDDQDDLSDASGSTSSGRRRGDGVPGAHTSSSSTTSASRRPLRRSRASLPVPSSSVGVNTEEAVPHKLARRLSEHLRELVEKLCPHEAAPTVRSPFETDEDEQTHTKTTTAAAAQPWRDTLRAMCASRSDPLFSPAEEAATSLKRQRSSSGAACGVADIAPADAAPQWSSALTTTLEQVNALVKAVSTPMEYGQAEPRYLLQRQPELNVSTHSGELKRVRVEVSETDTAGMRNQSHPLAKPLTASPISPDFTEGTEESADAREQLAQLRAVLRQANVGSVLDLYSELQALRYHRQKAISGHIATTTESLATHELLFQRVLAQSERELQLLNSAFTHRCRSNLSNEEDVSEDVVRLENHLQQLRRLRSSLDELRQSQVTVSGPATSAEPMPADAEGSAPVLTAPRPRRTGLASQALLSEFETERASLKAQLGQLQQQLDALRKDHCSLEERYAVATDRLQEQLQQPHGEGGASSPVQREVVHQLHRQRKALLERVVQVFGWNLEDISSRELVLSRAGQDDVVTVSLTASAINGEVCDNVAEALALHVLPRPSTATETVEPVPTVSEPLSDSPLRSPSSPPSTRSSSSSSLEDPSTLKGIVPVPLDELPPTPPDSSPSASAPTSPGANPLNGAVDLHDLPPTPPDSDDDHQQEVSPVHEGVASAPGNQDEYGEAAGSSVDDGADGREGSGVSALSNEGVRTGSMADHAVAACADDGEREPTPLPSIPPTTSDEDDDSIPNVQGSAHSTSPTPSQRSSSQPRSGSLQSARSGSTSPANEEETHTATSAPSSSVQWPGTEKKTDASPSLFGFSAPAAPLAPPAFNTATFSSAFSFGGASERRAAETNPKPFGFFCENELWSDEEKEEKPPT